jgi:hypothetical protein
MGTAFCSNAPRTRARREGEVVRIRKTAVRWLLALTALPLLAACGHAPWLQEPDTTVRLAAAGLVARFAREAAMNEEWQNHALSELVAAKGRPVLVLQIPGGGNPPGFVVVFGIDPDTGCIDAFAVSHDTDPLVRIYHCR